MRILPVLVGLLITAAAFWMMLPDPLFDDPLSTAIYDREGNLLGARIAGDGQWRFPPSDSLPHKYRQAVILYEDRYFNYHPGINIPSLTRALYQNIREGEVVSGGSTLTMQVMRMARKNRERTLWQKLLESLLSIRYELTATKEEILLNYASNAPFGGNVVGLEAASWRYFGTDPSNLSWAESALLAVLPNAPSLIHPGRNRNRLKSKRNQLLERLHEQGILDSLTCSLACEEPLPGKPLPLPNVASHVTDHFLANQPGKKHHTTLNAGIQAMAAELSGIHSRRLDKNQVHNLACLIVEVETGQIMAYVGNSPAGDGNLHENHVDVVRSTRSTGSILKPLLFAGMLDHGLLLQGSLLPDVPVQYDGYSPKNFNRGYEGAVPAYQALERSLNVPSVVMLKRFGVDPFLNLLENLGFTTFTYSHEHYGLSLILGGAETSLWELAGVYSSLARILNHYNSSDGNYFKNDLRMPLLQQHDQSGITPGTDPGDDPLEQGVISAGSVYLTFESMLKVNRPEELSSWYLMNSTSPIAWKTGTSYGFRDAWAIGITPEYLVAVWAGNADGEGRTGLTGLLAAAPVMFDLFDLLPGTTWFDKPADEFTEAVICSKSGHLAGQHCTETESAEICAGGINSAVCPYHNVVHLTLDGAFRVNSSCESIAEMKTESWFILPPLMEWYYKRKDPSYLVLPPIMEGCEDDAFAEMEIVYPRRGTQLVIPVELDGAKGRMVMEVAHRWSKAEIYWHMDDHYLGSTRQYHRMAVDLDPGQHRLTVVDQNGNSETVRFRVMKKQSDR
ncbi:MAG: penicillin-binding protein 1C [Bacteroidales bacterium]|nr:penicillin-binding protein 1C [Bacteroidales bacterium]